MTQIATIVGARPQFVKASAVSRAVRARPGMEEFLVHTGQHHDENMSGVFFRELGIPEPDRWLGIGGLGHGAMTGRMLEAIESVLIEVRPDWVLIYGDTNSTLAGALAASKLGIPVAHVEAGLRSWNREMPEEINRVVADHLSSLLLCPTGTAVENLAAEGVRHDPERGRPLVHLVGDVMLDVARHVAARNGSEAPEGLAVLPDPTAPFALATLHRAETVDRPERLASTLDGLGRVAKLLPVLLPLHPRTRRRLAALPGVAAPQGVHFVDPVGYPEMLKLLGACSLVLTDSGGLQKEAYFFARPCVTLRAETEWVELVAAGANTLAGWKAEAIEEAARRMLGVEVRPEAGLYGDGRAAEKIVDLLR